MPKAATVHYKLLNAAVDHFSYAVDVDRSSSAPMMETARASIASVRKAAVRAGDSELEAFCDSAERLIAELTSR